VFEKGDNGDGGAGPQGLTARTGNTGPVFGSDSLDSSSYPVGSADSSFGEAPIGGGGLSSSSSISCAVDERFVYFRPQLPIVPLLQPSGSRCSATTLIIGNVVNGFSLYLA